MMRKSSFILLLNLVLVFALSSFFQLSSSTENETENLYATFSSVDFQDCVYHQQSLPQKNESGVETLVTESEEEIESSSDSKASKNQKKYFTEHQSNCFDIKGLQNSVSFSENSFDENYAKSTGTPLYIKYSVFRI